MQKTIIALTAVLSVAFSVSAAEAGGWGKKGASNTTGGLVNVSPNVGVSVGGVQALSNIGVLNGSPILSGNKNSVGNVLSGVGLGNVAVSKKR